jgi:hypothetical protein
VVVLPDRVAAKRAFVLANAPQRNALGQVALKTDEGDEREPHPRDGDEEGAELERIDVVGKVVRGQHER